MDANDRATISARMAEYAAGLRYEDVPADVRDLAHLVLLDTLGCALAGSATDEVTAGLVFDAAHVARLEKAVRDIARSENVRTLDELMRPALEREVTSSRKEPCSPHRSR